MGAHIRAGGGTSHDSVLPGDRVGVPAPRGAAELRAGARSSTTPAGRRTVHEIELERDAIAAELHDGVMQSLVAARYAIDVAERAAGADAGNLHNVRAAIHDVLAEARRAMWNLRRRTTDGALTTALAALAERLTADTGADVTMRSGGVPEPLDPATADLGYRVVQAAVLAALRSGAQTVGVSLQANDGRVDIEISDDGPADDRARELERWLDRVGLVQGDSAVNRTDSGTHVFVRIPTASAGETS